MTAKKSFVKTEGLDEKFGISFKLFTLNKKPNSVKGYARHDVFPFYGSELSACSSFCKPISRIIEYDSEENF